MKTFFRAYLLAVLYLIISFNPLSSFAISYTGNGQSYYYGNVPFNYSVDAGGNTMLYDEQRNVLTLDGHNLFEGSNGTYIYSNVDSYHSNSNYWNIPLIQSITINKSSKWWIADENDIMPEFYIEILDGDGNMLFQSAYSMNSGLPITFHILPYTNILATEGYYLRIYEYNTSTYDVVCPYDIQLSANESKQYRFESEYISGSVLVCPNPAIDVHWGVCKTYDYFYTTFSRQGVDNQNKRLFNILNPSPKLPSLANAKFPNNSCSVSNTGYFFYGMGDHKTYGPLVCLDVIAHEYAHAINHSNPKRTLPSKGEGGALSESFSDIFACAVERYVFGETDWEMTGEAMLEKGACMRSLKDPKRTEKNVKPSPTTYKGDLWDFSKQDVHINAGVQNYWFYLLVNGGKGTKDDHGIIPWKVDGIGFDAAIRIVYHTFVNYITSTSTYSDCREYTLQAARELYGADSNAEIAVADAWYAVGIGKRHPKTSFTITDGRYVVVANRQTSRSKEWYYLSSETREMYGGRRLNAVETGVSSILDVNTYDVPDECIWMLTHTDTGWVMKCKGKYLNFGDDDDAFLGEEAMRFGMARDEYQALMGPAVNLNLRLSLSMMSSEDYFFFASPNSNGNITSGKIDLYFLPYTGLELIQDALPEVEAEGQAPRKVMHDKEIYILVPTEDEVHYYDLQGRLRL